MQELLYITLTSNLHEQVHITNNIYIFFYLQIDIDTSYESSSLWQPYHSLGGISAELSSMEYSHSVLDVTTEKKPVRNTSQYSTSVISHKLEQKCHVTTSHITSSTRLPTISNDNTDFFLLNDDNKEIFYPLSSTVVSNSGHSTDSGVDLLHISSISSKATADIYSQYFSLSTSYSNSLMQKGHTLNDLSHSTGSSHTSSQLNSRKYCKDMNMSKRLNSESHDPTDSAHASLIMLCSSFHEESPIDTAANNQKENLEKDQNVLDKNVVLYPEN